MLFLKLIENPENKELMISAPQTGTYVPSLVLPNTEGSLDEVVLARKRDVLLRSMQLGVYSPAEVSHMLDQEYAAAAKQIIDCSKLDPHPFAEPDVIMVATLLDSIKDPGISREVNARVLLLLKEIDQYLPLKVMEHQKGLQSLALPELIDTPLKPQIITLPAWNKLHVVSGVAVVAMTVATAVNPLLGGLVALGAMAGRLFYSPEGHKYREILRESNHRHEIFQPMPGDELEKIQRDRYQLAQDAIFQREAPVDKTKPFLQRLFSWGQRP